MNKYFDNTAAVQVIGNLFNNPSLFKEIAISEEDFTTSFHKIIVGSMYELYATGSESLLITNIVDFLKTRPKSYAVFEQNKGTEFLLKVKNEIEPNAFNYYYSRLKKMTLLRAYDKVGLDVSFLYDPENIFDVAKKERQEQWLDKTSLEEIANLITGKIEEVKSKYVDDTYTKIAEAGEGLKELKEHLKSFPEIGLPLYGDMLNSVIRGARLKKFILRSGGTNVGKSRAFIADACTLGCNHLYNLYTRQWEFTTPAQPTLFITTELEIEEVQTMMIAFLSGVNEKHILDGEYHGDEETRVDEAIHILEESPIYIEELPDFNIQDIENRISENVRLHGVNYVIFDYIHTTMKIMEEISKKSNGMKLREDNILFMLSIRLKDLCNQYGIFILSGTQLSGEFLNSKHPDQSLIRGAKSIADKCDVGLLLMQVTQEDLDSLGPIIDKGVFKTPRIKIAVYKNRRGEHKNVYLFCDADMGTCRITPMFATTYAYELIHIDKLSIKVKE